MKREAFTLLELIFVIVISAILSLGTFKAMESLYLRSAKAKAITDLSLNSQVVLDQLAALIYQRVPNSVIGYTPGGSCESIYELTASRPVLEWLAIDEAHLLSRAYDGFIDMNASLKPNLSALNISSAAMGDISNSNLIFAGTFDEGSDDITACNGAFGWHANNSNLSFDFSIPSDNAIQITDAVMPEFIYEKYYVTNGAYAVGRGANVLDITNCGVNESDYKDFNNTLFLFYNYYPYKGQTYCGDGGVGNVSVLAEHVSGFRASILNDTIRLSIDMNKTIRGSSAVHISKQKAVF